MKKKRLLSLLLCIALLLPTLSVRSASAAIDTAIQLGADGIGEGDKVFFGKYASLHDLDVPWIVLPSGALSESTPENVPSANAMPLFSEYLLGDSSYDDYRQGVESWYDYVTDYVLFLDTASALKSSIDGIYNRFSSVEQTAMASATLTNSKLIQNTEFGGGSSYVIEDLPGQKLFPISKNEAQPFVDALNPIRVAQPIVPTNPWNAKSWWLRTSYDTPPSTEAHLMFTNSSQNYTAIDKAKKGERNGVRPTFYLDTSKVVLASNAVGGKSAAGMDSGLTAVAATTPTAWKLTLYDDARSAFHITRKEWTGASVAIDYEGATTGAREYLSAVIVGSGDNVTYYGRIKSLTDAADERGQVTITIPPGVSLGAGTSLWVFNEQHNEERQDLERSGWQRAYTDYASRLQLVVTNYDIPSAAIGDVTVNGQIGSGILPKDATIALTNATFNVLTAGNDVLSWFANRPTGLVATVKSIAADNKSAVVTFSGTPMMTSAEAMTVTIPAVSLVENVSIAAYNTNARWFTMHS